MVDIFYGRRKKITVYSYTVHTNAGGANYNITVLGSRDGAAPELFHQSEYVLPSSKHPSNLVKTPPPQAGFLLSSGFYSMKILPH